MTDVMDRIGELAADIIMSHPIEGSVALVAARSIRALADGKPEESTALDAEDPPVLCPEHTAERIAAHVLAVFTDCCPDVKMSWDDWQSLNAYIELGIKEALGVPPEPAVDSGDPVTVQ